MAKNKNPKGYISGKITGLTEEIYKENFKHASILARDNGFIPVNPVEVKLDMCAGVEACGGQGEIHHWQCYMKHDLIEMLKCDVIILQPNWVDSSGAKLELQIADEVGMPSYVIDRYWAQLVPWRNHE